jgi:hypothetical protein
VGSKVVKTENVKQPSMSFVSVSVAHYMTQTWFYHMTERVFPIVILQEVIFTL